MYPSSTKLEGEIVAMTLGMMHGEGRPTASGALVTTAGPARIMTRSRLPRGAASRGITRPNREAGDRPLALDKGCHYFG